ncbi:MAG: PAS domain-containing sensor histidine kinase [Bacteroidetes bacterium]|nr:MAG: PAS domain-containing sensor histidine kinase [Bacteroidota bacterium]
MDSKEGLEALFEFATEGILVTNHTGTIIKTNPATERMFGYGKNELIGKKVEVLVPARHSHSHVAHRDKYNGSPHARSMGAAMDLYAKRQDGSEFPVEISLSPFTASDGQFVIAFIIDITIRKKAEESVIQQKKELELLNTDLEKRVKERTMILEEAISELNQTKEELNDALQKEKELNDLKSRFVSMASHEFRTPLATILSSLSLATKYSEKGDKENQAKHINRIKTSIGNLTDILNDFLSISKFEEGKISASPEKLNIKEFVSELLKEVQSIVKTGQNLDYTHSGYAETVSDKKFLRHILLNLLSNAIKFSPEGKSIVLKTEVNKSHFIFSVKDSGIGISEEDQKHLFERFFRAHNATNIQGTGLGLNIVSKYVEMLDGTIDFKSALAKGTTFTIHLPTGNGN